MADEIISKLGFNVDEALKAISKLDTTLAGLEKRMSSLSSTISQFNGVASQVDRIGKAIDKSMETGAKAADRLTVSWGMMARIVTTQVIVRALSQLRRTFERTGEAAVAFERQVALIKTIDDSGQSFDKTADSVRKLSDAFNIPLAEAGAGTYQTISNQVGGVAESLEFMSDAAKFAKATGSSLKDSVDLLSGALKSYNLNAQDAGKVSGIFFSAIDKGRITAQEIAQKFGTVGPMAAQLGVPLEEVAGALAAISVKGSNSAHTLTMYRQILASLQKPTAELAKELNKLGYATPEAAIATEHLDGLLKSLTAGKTSIDLGKMFPNIRATSGVASLSSDFKTLAEDIEAARKSGANFAQDKWLTATNTNAEAVTAEINKLKNALTVDLGRSVLSAVNDLSKLVGGAENVISIAKAAGPALLGLGAGFLGLRASIAAARLEAAGLSKVLGVVAALPVAAGVGSSIGQYIGGRIAQNSLAELTALEAANKTALDEFKRQQSERRDAANNADAARVQAALRVVQQLNKAYLRDVENAKRASDAVVKNAQAGLQTYLSTREQLVSAMERGAAEARETAKASQFRVSDLTQQRQDRDFFQSLSGFGDSDKASKMLDRAREQAYQASAMLSKATDRDSLNQALKMFERAQGIGEQAASISERTENRFMEAKAAEALKAITDQQIEAEKRLQSLQQERAVALESARESQQKAVDAIRSQIKVALDNASPFDKEGKLLPTDELAKRSVARQAALKSIAESALTSKDLDMSKALGLADFVSRFNSELTRDPIRLAFDVENGIQRAQASVQASFARFKVQFQIEPLEAALGRKLGTPDEVARGLVEAQKKAAELRSTFDAAVTTRKGATDTVLSTATAASNALDRIQNRVNNFGGIRTGFIDQVESSVKTLRDTLNDPNLNADKVRAVAEAMKPVTDRSTLAYAGLWNAPNAADIGTVLTALSKRAEAIKALQAPLPDASQLQQLEGVIQRLQVPAELGNLGPAIGAGVGPSADVAANLWSGAEAARQIAVNLAMASMSDPMGMATGGPLRYFASGGRGTDTIPAMLSPGEFVVNSRSAARFAPQLVAMNAGIQPVFRQDGGNTYNNTTVGDIIVNGAKGPQQTARAVMAEIRRELHRGSGSL